MRVLGVLFLFLLLASPLQSAAAGDDCADGKLRPVTVVDNDKLILRWTGKVNKKMAQLIDDAFEKYEKRVTSVELSLHSCGGRIDYMAQVVGVLHHIKERHKLTTVVDQGDTCASACIPIFLASNNRRAALSSVWFFHRSWRNELSGGVDEIHTAAPGSRSVASFHKKYYEPAGVSPEWLRRLANVIENNGGYWQTGRDLWEAKSGMVTETIGDVKLDDNRTIFIAPAPGCTAMCRG